MSYHPRREDLDDLTMPDELRRLADAILPGNREQLAELLQGGVRSLQAGPSSADPRPLFGDYMAGSLDTLRWRRMWDVPPVIRSATLITLDP